MTDTERMVEELRAEWRERAALSLVEQQVRRATMDQRDLAFAEAVSLAEEAIGYVPVYFRDKWDMDNKLAELKAKVAPEVHGEFWA